MRSKTVTLAFVAVALVLSLSGTIALAEPPQKGPSRPADASPGGQQAVPKKGDRPGLAVQQPKTPAERERALSNLYAHLATSADAEGARAVASAIERIWTTSGSDTVKVLLERATGLANGKNTELAVKILDAAVDLAPDHADAWFRRATVHYQRNDIERSLGDLRRVLALDANHYKALEALAHVLKEIGQKKAALNALRRLADVHPFREGVKTAIDELARQVEGQSL
jgi:tetratricopeptide (TPR) repeat protein